MNTRLRNIFTASFLALSVSDQGVVAFCLVAVSSIDSIHGTGSIAFIKRNRQEFQHVSSTSLHASPERDDLTLSESSQTILGVTGTVASLIVFYSEFTLKTTGCGVPAGPFGLFGLAEGLSYLGVTGLVAYSLVTKVKTGSGLPAGPSGLLGAAEGLSFLAIVVGLIVLALQVTNYGYIPNAIPMEGAMCS